MNQSLHRLFAVSLFSLFLVSCGGGRDATVGLDGAPEETGAAGASMPGTSEPSQEEINQRLMAERRADPLLQFEPLYDPQYVKASEATHLQPEDRVFGVVHGGVAKAYPTEYVAWHHIIQDDFGDVPILASWCALCGSGAAYVNDINGKPGTFRIVGSAGSNVQLGDQLTGNAIQQATGEFVIGDLIGRKMARVTTIHATLSEWLEDYPVSQVMLPLVDLQAAYDHYKPMLGTANERFRGSLLDDDRRPRHDLVVGLDVGGGHKAYPLKELAKENLLNDRVGSEPVLVTYNPATDTARAFSRELNGDILTFSHDAEGNLVDQETGSLWNGTGMAVSGRHAGTQLDVLSPLPSFWFSWAQFYPQTDVFIADMGSSESN